LKAIINAANKSKKGHSLYKTTKAIAKGKMRTKIPAEPLSSTFPVIVLVTIA
jgi:hypothetical protein